MNNLIIGKKLFDKTFDFLQRSLDIRTSRQKVLSSNIANAETPDYVSRDIPFQKILEQSVENSSSLHLQKTHAMHFPEPAAPSVALTLDTEMESEAVEEEVNLDQEMSKLAENNLMFQAGVQALMKKLEALKVTISEGR